MAEEDRIWARDAEELAACFTVHARDLFGYACVLTEADRPLAGDLVQAAFQAAATVWCTLRDLPADQLYDQLRGALAAALQRRTGHPAGRAFNSPSHRRLTELTMARFGRDYDAVAGLDRFAGWLRAHTAEGALNSTDANGAHANGTAISGFHANGVSPNQGTVCPPGTSANAAPGSYGDPVSVLYEEHYASLVRLAALLVHDKATAEEIVQDSFVAIAAAWRRRGSLACPLDFLRQSVVQRSRSGRYRPAAANGSPNGSAPLLAALGALPARQREVLVMRYYANLSEEQAADVIGISRAAVRRHATRANAALRTLLDAG
ncbi:MAG TPA: sigma factor-like helix-turn-helix DNA-binding protein [Streptosporangiaceae bacterium]|nr:sigma factor-like helix-turn-helix DNA-binding protein [Streptosporangiaceae bacterium]